jgi:hypothetical protein
MPTLSGGLRARLFRKNQVEKLLLLHDVNIGQIDGNFRFYRLP